MRARDVVTMSELLDRTPVALALVTALGTVRECTPAFATLLDAAGERELVGTPLGARLEPAEAGILGSLLASAVTRKGEVVAGEVRVGDRVLELAITDVAPGRPLPVLAIDAHDVTVRVDAAKALRHALRHDRRTGVLSRDGLVDATRAAIASGRTTAVVVAALEGLSSLDGSHGRGAAEDVAIELTARLDAAVDGRAAIARPAPDRIAICVEGFGERKAAAVATRLLELVAEPIVQPDGRRVALGASAGVAVGAGDIDGADLVRNAEVALDAARAVGVGRVCVYDATIDGRLVSANDALAGMAERLAALETRNAQLSAELRTDPLTGLANLRSLREEWAELDARARRSGRPYSLLFLDIDHFGDVNKRHGQDVGDVVLESVADAVRATVRGSDRVYRRGGEELMVLLPDASLTTATAVAERVRVAVATLHERDEHVPERVTVTIGVAQLDERVHPTPEALGAAADEAVYRAKRRDGRNRVWVAAGLCEHPAGRSALAPAPPAT